MFSIKSIDHLVLRTQNPEPMIKFYCEVLGCQVEREPKKIGLVQMRAGGNLIDLIKVDASVDRGRHNLEHFCLRIVPFDFNSLKQYFLDHGIEVSRYAERYGAQGMGYSFYLNDPDGNEVELTEDKS